ncbi:HET-domain-containing protein, partial [Melanomma pulvis-pyrius CBS 109.77]
EWLNTCKTSHTTCEAIDETRNPEYYPMGLLDIGNRKSSTIRLIITEFERLPDMCRYATLSHCWGANPLFLALSKANVNLLRQFIPPEGLPKSFVEAIQICRRLGVRYLWIDSLCILQSRPGSQEDRLVHAAKMDTIYANCELNL